MTVVTRVQWPETQVWRLGHGRWPLAVEDESKTRGFQLASVAGLTHVYPPLRQQTTLERPVGSMQTVFMDNQPSWHVNQVMACQSGQTALSGCSSNSDQHDDATECITRSPKQH